MIRRFCDACGSEIPSTANRSVFQKYFGPEARPETPSTKIEVEVLVSVNGTANGGDICVACIRTTVAQGGLQSTLRAL